MEISLRDELIDILSDLIGDIVLLDCLLDGIEADYCTPEVFQALRARLSGYIEQHTRDLASVVRALSRAPATPHA